MGKPPALGFTVAIKWKPSLTMAEVKRFTDDFVEAIEAQGLEIGGGCGPETADYCVSRYEGSVTKDQRQAVAVWLMGRVGGTADLECGLLGAET